jgi:hypothetical protein
VWYAVTMSNDWKARQHRLNLFTAQYLKGVGKIREDGDPGPSTRKRIREAKFWLGWLDKNVSGVWDDDLHGALLTPTAQSKATVARFRDRVKAHNRAWAKSHMNPIGVTTFDGVRVARWMVPYLKWARAHGWHGWLISGFRDPAYSEWLCFHMCGKPQCPGKCAGRSSRHVGKKKPNGAVDVAHYDEFAAVMRHCPLSPRIFNSLGAQDPVHFSAQGN